MNVRTLAQHLRRYPWWYALSAVWLIAMVALPIVQGTTFETVLGGGPAPASAVGDASGTPPEFAADPEGHPVDSGVDVVDDGPAPSEPDPEIIPDAEPDDALELVPPELLDAIFDALPTLVVPPLPDELTPVLNAIAPVAASGCSGLGLAGVVVAVAAQSADGVPIERILPYLAPASTACASFPIPRRHTECEADEPFVIDFGGLMKSPPLLGMGIDQLRAFERLLGATFGQSIPSVADELATQLNCTLVE